MDNLYKPFLSEIKSITKHTEDEYTFRMAFSGDVKYGQFFEVSIPKYGEAPISVSGIGEGYVDMTIRKVGKVTNELFEGSVGKSFFMRGPYGNGFEVSDYKGKELIIVAGGTGVSPVRGVINYFTQNLGEVTRLSVLTGFRSPDEILFQEDIKAWEQNQHYVCTVDKGCEGYTGNEGFVTDYIPKVEVSDAKTAQAIVVGPPVMMQVAVKALLEKGLTEENIWVSYERRMSCGLGKCGHCRMSDKYICLDGPVFRYADAKNLVD